MELFIKKEEIRVDNVAFIRLLICIIICRLCSYIYFTENLAVLFIKCKTSKKSTVS